MYHLKIVHGISKIVHGISASVIKRGLMPSEGEEIIMNVSIRGGVSALPILQLLLLPAVAALPPWATDGLTGTQHQEMRLGLKDAEKQSWRVEPQEALGKAVPDTIALQGFPAKVADEVPALKRYDFFVTSSNIFVVDRSSRKVIDIVGR